MIEENTDLNLRIEEAIEKWAKIEREQLGEDPDQ